MEFATAIGTAIAGKIVEYSVEPIKRQVDYVIHCKSNLEKLKIELNDLTYDRSRIERKIAEATGKGGKIIKEVETWVEEVDEVTGKTNQLKDEYANGCCLNLRMRHQLSRKSIQLVGKVLRLQKKEFPEISSGYLREEVSGISTGDYLPFDSRESIVKQVMDELKNPNTVRIEVCGIGGVGKTTLVKQVFRKAKQDSNLFYKIAILFDVKSIPDLEGIQKQIVEKLEMDLVKDETMVNRTSRLCGYIKNKKILIILDDVQNEINLDHLGVPRVATCKILLTSRIPISGMSSDKSFKLAILREEETWELFANKAGVLDKVPAIQRVAKQVAKKCGGLPVLVVTVANSLKNRKSLHAWENALRCLEEFDHKDNSPEKEAHMTIEWSYNQLDDSMLKDLFLLCGTTVRRNRICLEDLLKYSMGLSLFKNVLTVEQIRNAFYSKVEELKDFCLLLDGDDDTSVRMHDIVRDAAKHIALRDHHMLSTVEDGGDQSDRKGWPNTDFIENCTTISFPSAKNIPEVMQCPALKMFLLQGNQNYYQRTILPRLSFEEMKQLRVLSLGHMHIPSLPSSLQCLSNLQTLCLHQCVLGDLSLVGQLNNLEILSLEGSGVDQLPKEIGQLTRLRLFDLSSCDRLKVVSPGVISSLTRLEELRMRESFKNWKAAGDRSNASLFEFKHLSQLTALQVHVPDANILPADFFSHELKRFQIMIGDKWKWDDKDDRTLNTLKLKLTTASSIELVRGIKKLLNICDDLSLYGTESVNHIVRHLDSQEFPQLRHLILQNNVGFQYINKKDVFPNLTTLTVYRCDHLSFLFSFSMAKSLTELKHLEISEGAIMEEIVSSRECSRENMDNMFSKLENLKLIGLPNLTKLCSGSYVQFPSLKNLYIKYCHSLKQIFPTHVARGLQQLDQLTVKFCDRVEAIIGEEDVQEARPPQFEFPKATSVKFEGLPRLRSFYPRMHVSHWPLLKTLEVCHVYEVENFAAELSFFWKKHEQNPRTQPSLFLIEKNSFLNLEHLKLRDMEIWNGPPPAGLFWRKLKYIHFNNCRASSLFLLQKLSPNLELIEVGGGSCKEIFVNVPKKRKSCGEINGVGSETFTHVRKLWLYYLSNLLHLGNSQSAAACSPLFPNLQILKVEGCGSLKNLESSTISFQNITTLKVEWCEGLEYLTSYSVAKSLVQLTTLKVSRCSRILAIVQASNIVGQDDAACHEITFRRLQYLKLHQLPGLQGFCSSGNCTVKIPSSVTFDVLYCPIKLNISPDGVLLTVKR